MRTDTGEAEVDQRPAIIIRWDAEMFGREGGFGDAFPLDDAGIERQRELAGRVWAEDVSFPGHAAAAAAAIRGRRRRGGGGAKKEGFIRREMAEAEFLIGHGEEARLELLAVGFARAGDVAGAPAGVDEFPFAVVDLDRVPRVVAAFRRDGRVGRQGGVAEAFAVAADDEAFEAGFGGEGGEEAGVAFADGEAGLQRGGGRGGFDGVVEEGDGVVGDVVVQPGEDGAGFICG